MKISEAQWVKVHYIKKFDNTRCILDKNVHLLLDSIIVFAVTEGMVVSEVDYQITSDRKAGQIMIDVFPTECDYFILHADRFAWAKTFEIKADEYIDKIEHDGCFIFTTEAEE